jgi:hypothetical protein
MEKLALIIPTRPARKRTGFAGVGFVGDEQTEEIEDEEMISVTE